MNSINLTDDNLGTIIFDITLDHNNKLNSSAKTNLTNPTFRIFTNESSVCALGVDVDKNYTDMNAFDATSDCSTQPDGSSHGICTLSTAQTATIGLHNFSIGCKDVSAAANENRTSTSGNFTINITDSIPPKVEPDVPIDNVFFATGVNNTIKFNWTCNDNFDETYIANMYIDDVLEYTNKSYLNGTEAILRKSITTLGSHTWHANCTDSFNNVNGSEVRNFEILDGTPPNITILSPENNSVHTVDFVDLNWASDEVVDWCVYSLDGGANNTDICIISIFGYCFQETANESTDCGGLATPITSDYFENISNTNWRDENINTYSEPPIGEHAEFFINYTIPHNLSSVLWEISYYDVFSPNNIHIRNLTVPAACLNDTSGRLRFRIFSDHVAPTSNKWFCFNTSSQSETLLHFNDSQSGSNVYRIREESVWWFFDGGTTSINVTLTSLSEASHNVTIWANDTSGNLGQSDYHYFDIDGTPPIVNVSISNPSPKINEFINISANITDGVGLSFCQFIHNMTGIVNITNVSLSGTSAQCSNVTQISGSEGDVINFTIRANDTANHFTTNDTIIEVVGITPPEMNLINLTDDNLGFIIFNISSPANNKLNLSPKTNASFTIRATLDEPGTCAIGVGVDFNYTNMIAYDASSECSTTGTTEQICSSTTTFSIVPRLTNVSIGCKDGDNNENRTSTSGNFTLNITDETKPNGTLHIPLVDTVFTIGVNNTGINFTSSCTDNFDSIFKHETLIDEEVKSTNLTYNNGTNVSYFIDVTTIGFHNWSVRCTDNANNINQTGNRTFEVRDLDITLALDEPTNNTLIYSEDDIQFNFTITFTENIDTCSIVINGTINQTNESRIDSAIKYTINGTNLSINNDYEWNVRCNVSTGLDRNSSDKFNLFVYDPVNVSYTVPTPANNTIITELWIPINVTTRGRILNFTLEFNGVNESITFNNSLNLVINKTGLVDLTEYTFKIYVNDSNGNSNQTEQRTVTTNTLGLTVSISNGISFSFSPFIENTTLRTLNISCAGQNHTIGCINASVFGDSTLNFSLLFNLSVDPPNQRLLEDFSINALNWSVFQLRSNNTQNLTLVNASVACAEVQSLNSTGLFEYRFNNTLETTYRSTNNQSVLINVSMDCPKVNYFTKILNGTQKNITGFDSLNFSWRGDATSNQFVVDLIDEAGTKVSSPTLSLANTEFSQSGIELGALKNISVINITVTNVTGTSGLSAFFMDNIRLTNVTSNQSSRIKMKANCVENYANATLLEPNALTSICIIPSNSITKYIWLYQDINLTQKGMRWRLLYSAVVVT